MSVQPRGQVTTRSEGRERAGNQRPRRAARKQARLEAKLAAAERLIAKRTRQLGSASDRRASLAARLARRSASTGDGAGPMAYCLKDRRQVVIGGAQSVVLSSGRPAVAGTCPSCGSRVVRFVPA